MKKLNWLMVFWIVLFLAGCSNVAAPTSTLEASTTEATPTFISPTETPTFTLTPTFTITPTFTPSWTQLPTFSSEDEVYGLLSRWMNEAAECDFPCWGGVYPGETSWNASLHMLHPVISDLAKRKNGIEGVYVNEKGNCRFGDCAILDFNFLLNNQKYEVTLFSKNDIIYSIEINGNAFSNFSVQDILKKYGKPSQVYLIVNPYYDYTKYSPEIYIILHYPKKKLVIKYYSIRLAVIDENLVTCLNKPYSFMLGVVDIPQGEWPGIEIANAGDQTTHGFQGIGGFKPIADVSKMTVDSFYQMGIMENSSLCIYTPEKYWK
jgi:hypothetical protein